MAINTYGTATSGNPTNVYQMPKLLMAADAVQCIDKVSLGVPVPKNKNETVSMLRLVTPSVDTTESPEGITKASRAVVYEQVTVTLGEFDEYFTVSSRQAELGERDVIDDCKDRLKDLIRRTRELNGWYTARAGTNTFFNSSSHSAITDVNGAITLGRLRVASRLIQNNRGQRITAMHKGSQLVGSTPVEPAYVVMCHTDCQSDIRNLPSFRPAPHLASKAMPNAFGQSEEFLFVTSPEFEPRLAAGAAVGATGMKSVGGVSVDVYDYVIFSDEAFARVTLAGSEKEGLGGAEFYALINAEKSDPTNKRRIVGARWWDAPVITNQNWIAKIQCGVTANPT